MFANHNPDIPKGWTCKVLAAWAAEEITLKEQGSGDEVLKGKMTGHLGRLRFQMNNKKSVVGADMYMCRKK